MCWILGWTYLRGRREIRKRLGNEAFRQMGDELNGDVQDLVG